MLGRLISSYVAILLLASCEAITSPDSAALGSGLSSYSAKIAVIEEHPFDIEKMLVAGPVVEANDILQFMIARGIDEVGTDYDRMNSIVTIVDGPLEKGDVVTMRYRQFVDKWYDYQRKTVIEHDPNGGPVVIVNSYRIARPASATVYAIVNGETVAEKKFKARGPRHDFGPDWSIDPGGRKLSAAEAREALAGNRFRRDEGGILFFKLGGSYFFSGERGEISGHWEIEDDGKVCVKFTDGRRNCSTLYYDVAGRLHYSNRGSRKFRLRREA